MRCLAAALLAAALSQLLPATWIVLKAELAQQLIARAWREPGNQKPWPWADTWPIARLRIPNIVKPLYVLQQSGGEGLAFGPVRLKPALPIGNGEDSLVIAGHRDTHFRQLASLHPGDLLYLEEKGATEMTYRVQQSRVMDSRREQLLPVPGGLLLVTCFPFDSLDSGGPLRYVVLALPQFIHNPS